VGYRSSVLGLIAVTAAIVLFSGLRLDDPVWWLTNETPPHLSVSGPSEPVRASIAVRISAEPHASLRIHSIRLDDRLVTADQSGTLASTRAA
jgi:hypothetical protein